MNPLDVILWLGWTLCLAVSFLLSGMEAGVFAMNTFRLRRQARSGVSTAQRLLKFLADPERFLWTIFVGNTLANFAVIVWLLVVFEAWLGGRSWLMWTAYALAVLVFYIACDLLPKTLFRAYPNRLCPALSGPLRLIELALRPLVRLLQAGAALMPGDRRQPMCGGAGFRNREELRAVMQESAGGFTSEERQLINRVLDLHALTVRQVMKPIQLAVTLNMDSRLFEALALGRERGLTRFPVWEVRDNRRRIAGILDLDTVIYRDDLDPGDGIARFVKPAVFLPEQMPVEKALRRMRQSGQALAVVVGGHERELGLLALQDVLKRIFGEVAF